jgi:TatD-related deoxyribonuclease
MEALHKGDRFLMETDYIDDPRRPGAVLGPRTVPKLTIALFTEHIMTEQQLYKIHVENPQNTYNIILKEK